MIRASIILTSMAFQDFREVDLDREIGALDIGVGEVQIRNLQIAAMPRYLYQKWERSRVPGGSHIACMAFNIY